MNWPLSLRHSREAVKAAMVSRTFGSGGFSFFHAFCAAAFPRFFGYAFQNSAKETSCAALRMEFERSEPTSERSTASAAGCAREYLFVHSFSYLLFLL